MDDDQSKQEQENSKDNQDKQEQEDSQTGDQEKEDDTKDTETQETLEIPSTLTVKVDETKTLDAQGKNMTYSVDNAVIEKKYNAWVADEDYYYYRKGFNSIDELPDDFVITQDEVKKMSLDDNTNTAPEHGYIYDGTAQPGTPF